MAEQHAEAPVGTSRGSIRPYKPADGATAFSGSPYFTYNPGDRYGAWDMQVTADYMPREFVTFRVE